MRLTHALAVAAILAAPIQALAGPHGKPAGATHATTTTATTTTRPVATKIEQHPQLASRLKTMLPSGMTLAQASAGFRNQGQFIAALHVSRNLGIPFKDLREQMIDHHRSLGQSIQRLKPSANSTTEAHHAEIEAEDDLK